MPHLILEYSANIEEKADIPALLKLVHAAALETGLFPIGGIRVRAIRCDHYLIGDGHPDNGFIHMTGKIGPGRDLEARQKASHHIFSAFKDALAEMYDKHPLALSFELAELAAETRFNHNNLHDIIKMRSGPKAS